MPRIVRAAHRCGPCRGDKHRVAFAEACNPPITTVRQARREIGEQTAMLLLKLIDGELAVKREIRLAADLVIRKSTAAATR